MKSCVILASQLVRSLSLFALLAIFGVASSCSLLTPGKQERSPTALKVGTSTLSITTPQGSFVPSAEISAVTFSGDCPAGSTLFFQLNQLNQGVSQKCPGSSGTETWIRAINLAALPDGPITLSVTATSSLGKIAGPVSATYVKNTIPPSLDSLTLSLHAPSASPGTLTTPSVRAQGLNGVQSIQLFSDALCNSQLSTTILDPTSQPQPNTADLTSPELVPGFYTFSVKLIDAAGNISPCSGQASPPKTVAYRLLRPVTLSMTPTLHDFGEVTVGTESHYATLTFANAMDAATATQCSVTLTGAAVSEFQIVAQTCGSTLAAGEACQALVKARPRSAGTPAAALRYQCTEAQLEVPLTATATGVVPIAWSPLALNLGNSFPGKATSTQSIYFTNPSFLPLSGCQAPSVSSPQFQIVSDTCGTQSLEPYSQCEVKAQFRPEASEPPGTLNESLTRTCGTTTYSAPLTASVTGLSTDQIKQVATGYSHACAVLYTGSVYCWGENDVGQLGNNDTADSATPVPVIGISQATAVIAGLNNSCALLTNSKVQCWGDDGYGELGDGPSATLFSKTPVTVKLDSGGTLSDLSGVTELTLGRNHSCALLSSGEVACWGYGAYGQLGLGNTSNSNSAKVIPALTDVTRIAAGFYHACAVLSDTTARCWGYNDRGQIGDGTSSNTRPNPVSVLSQAGGGPLSGITQMTAGFGFTCARLSNQTLRCWGSNEDGRLGINSSNTNPFPYPMAVPSISTAVEVTAGTNSACVRLADGSARCWGANLGGELGDGTSQIRRSPTPMVGLTQIAQISVGYKSTCAIESGTRDLFCWGQNLAGNIGNGRFTPYRPSPLAHLPQVSQLALSMYNSCAVRTSGQVQCWGKNDSRQLGNPAVLQTVAGIPTSVLTSANSPLQQVARVAVGTSHACAWVKSQPSDLTGKVRCWGNSSDGQLGTGNYSLTLYATPVVLSTGGPELDGVTAIASGDAHTCVLRKEGSNSVPYCWGLNSSGQLGRSGLTKSNVPLAVAGITQATQLVTGWAHTCALVSENGTSAVKCWGLGTSGELGNQTQSNSATPVTVKNLKKPIFIAAGNNHACAIEEVGTVQCWGANSSGQLGDGTLISKNTPVTVSGLTQATSISGGRRHTCAIAGGKTWCWGSALHGLMGTGTETPPDSKTPLPVLGAPLLSELSASAYHTCGWRADGNPLCWGNPLDVFLTNHPDSLIKHPVSGF